MRIDVVKAAESIAVFAHSERELQGAYTSK